ncbi:MAG: hypothetical protein ACTTKH_07200 [Treponema sp.]
MNEDIFNSLLDVEQASSNMVFEAQIEADDKVLAVKKEIDEKYRITYDEIVDKLGASFENQKKITDDSFKKELEAYVDSLSSIKPNVDAFNKLLENYFFSS